MISLQIHLGMCQSVTNEGWANDNWSAHGDDNGIVFSKQCLPLNDGVKKCFNTFKKKTCFHPTEMVSLNHVGQYVIFPARWWHRGYFHIRSNTTYYTAQLFCTAARDIDSWPNQTRSGTRHTLNQSSVHPRRLTVRSILPVTDISKKIHSGENPKWRHL